MMVDNVMKNIQMQTLLPKFDLGREVYAVLGPDNICQGRITAYRSWVINDESTGLLVVPKEARLSLYTITDYFSDIEDDAVPFQYLTDNEEEVERWSKVFPVECSDEEWFKAIGKRPTIDEMVEAGKNGKFDSEDSLEESELGSCCGSISDIRTILIKCRDNKKSIGWEVERLQWLCNNSGHDMPENAPILTNILKQLGVKWDNEEN